ncbi:hypothetical protein OO007_16665 [Cocleimonas sp. KMM 6892]|uniref:ABC-three component system middle component 1 n=1 Tax=unclassified Cocleimonas TaxID=2639732 RepID=UPI002DBAE142|nr:MULTISPECIES: ABC-three component system middle component 1 [unclassified Cocleimonas]MEB8433872.1 hypothetical protein [Cocleimonas sp. KMM 6892]MEC4716683.1 hypothetical protein [Cocleimonas sp. KMM 6895]MEC4746162.1 hypothetical protein [Cocleimonas sp. KMM 6896]
MLDILQKLCESNKFVVHEFESNIEDVNSKIVVPNSDNNNQEYYFILECKSVNDTLITNLTNDHAEKFMDKLEELEFTDESLRKNCTMILCCENSNISEQTLLQFEEDPYYFKKNVITYSKEELLAFEQELNNQYSNEYLNKLLMSDGLFELFKTHSLGNDSYYPLLIKVITKLPFIHYLPQQNQLNDLEEFVKTELDESSIKLLDFICREDENLSEEIIDEKISTVWSEL